MIEFLLSFFKHADDDIVQLLFSGFHVLWEIDNRLLFDNKVVGLDFLCWLCWLFSGFHVGYVGFALRQDHPYGV